MFSTKEAQSTHRQQSNNINMDQVDMKDNYAHKKFTAVKRKRSQDEEEQDDVIFVSSQLPAKRRFFRPWQDDTLAAPEQLQTPRKSSSRKISNNTYHANMARTQTPRLRSPKAQKRRDQNTLACLLSRRARKAQEVALEQQYQQFQQQHEANLQQQIRLSLYYVRFLQQAMASTREPLPPTKQQSLEQNRSSRNVGPNKKQPA